LDLLKMKMDAETKENKQSDDPILKTLKNN